VYKVPPLEFTGEDISVEFLLTTVSGEIPKMYASFCKESKGNLSSCGDPSDFSKYQQAKPAGRGLSLIIDHDEGLCDTVYHGECYYTVVI
jgi:hypothetical protein